MAELWEHQKAGVNAIRAAFASGHRRVGYMLSTGGGKTRLCADIIKMALEKNKKVMFVVNRKTLVNQTSIAFDELGIDHGVVQSDHWRYKPWLPVQVCSIQSLMRRKKIDSDFVIVDEFHNHFKYMTEMMKVWSLVKFLGVSATPWTKGLGKHWDYLVVGANTAYLQDKGVLIPPIVYSTRSMPAKGLKVVNGEYDKKQVAVIASNQNIKADVIDTYLKYGENRKAICFPCNVNHSRDIVNEFNLAGIPALHIDAHTTDLDRGEAFEKHKSGEVQILSSVGVLQVGHDEKSIGCVILARPIKSLILYVQCTGRGARCHPDLKDYILIDLGENVDRLGWPDDEFSTELCDGTKTEAKKDKEREEKKETELKDKDCPACNQLVKGKIFTCPSCGYLFSRKSIVKVENDEVVKLKRKKQTTAEKRNKTISTHDKQAFYSAALAHCVKKGYKEGWASNKYRDYFSVWPSKIGKISGGHSDLFSSYLTACNIRYARSQNKMVK